MILVMVGFSSILYWSAERSIVLQMDTRLEGAVRYLDAALRAFPINELLRPNPFSPPGNLPRDGAGFASKDGLPRDPSTGPNDKRPPTAEKAPQQGRTDGRSPGERSQGERPGDRPQPYAVYVDDEDKVWLADWGANTLVRFDPVTEKFESFPLPAETLEIGPLGRDVGLGPVEELPDFGAGDQANGESGAHGTEV